MKIPGFGLTLIQLCLNLSIYSYTRKYNNPDLEVLYEGIFHSTLFHPFYYVSKLNNNLFITIRGSNDEGDMGSLQYRNLVPTKYGYFTEAIYRSSYYIYLETYETIKNFDGDVYITGHSFGGSISSALLTIFKAEFPDRNFYAISFASTPSIPKNQTNLYKDLIATIVNEYDIIPLLAPHTLFNTISSTIPGFLSLPFSLAYNRFQEILGLYTMSKNPADPFILDIVNQSFQYYYPLMVDYKQTGLLNYCLPGTIYLIGEKKNSIDECLVEDQFETFKEISLNPKAITFHTPVPYLNSLKLIGQDQENNNNDL